MDEEWTDWFQHDGQCDPVAAGVVVHMVFEDGDEWIGQEGCCGLSMFGDEVYTDDMPGSSWIWGTGYAGIIRYRIRKPKALRELIDMVENLPVKEDA